VERLECLEARAAEKDFQVQIGYLKRLPADYQGDRHVVTVGQQAADGTRPGRYERPGLAPIPSTPQNMLRVCVVRSELREREKRVRDTEMRAVVQRVRRLEIRFMSGRGRLRRFRIIVRPLDCGAK
jgi:hypothetical protein